MTYAKGPWYIGKKESMVVETLFGVWFLFCMDPTYMPHDDEDREEGEGREGL